MDWQIPMELVRLFLFILPAYFANSSPVLLGGGKPIDFGKKFIDKKRIFGDGKTILGFVAGIVCGTLVGVLLAYALHGTQFAIYETQLDYAWGGFLLSLGTMLGDLAGSFAKRRLGMPQGKPSLVMDQLSFFLFAIAFSTLANPQVLSLWGVAFLAVATYFVHKGANIFANRTGLKKVPW